jgi:hypothetical protein
MGRDGRFFGGRGRGLSAVLAVAAAPVLAGGVVVETAFLDNGDADGFADTLETVEVALTVTNGTGIALTGVGARLVTYDPDRVCITDPFVSIGDLAVGEERAVTERFVIHVLDVDRATLGLGPYDDLSAEFEILIESTPQGQHALPRKFTLDLDLDVAGGSGPTTFFESFEGTLGQFEVENLDGGKYDLAASDGYRCQYHDPDWQHSNSFGRTECHLGVASSAHADAVFWGLSGPSFSPEGGRAFTGFHSLFYGIDLGPPKNWTTPVTVLEAVRTTQPIHLPAAGAGAVLSLKHQVSFYGGALVTDPYDRAVAMVQVADAAGSPAGPWFKIEAVQNAYHTVPRTIYVNCFFDVIDDGTDEDDFFEPADPARRYGPSSTCYPGYVWSDVGETSNPFAPGNVGGADGPGLAGQWGLGTWVESKFDLTRFRGRSIRVRFLTSAPEVGAGIESWDAYNPEGFNPTRIDDGWWIDDVTVTGAVTTPATASVDLHDNSGLPPPPSGDGDLDGVCDAMDNCAAESTPYMADRDADGAGDSCDPCPDEHGLPGPDHDDDGLCIDNCPFVFNPSQANADGDPAGNACDCMPNDPKVYPGAPEINDNKDNQCPGEYGYGVKDELTGSVLFTDETTLSWEAQVGATSYQVARSKNSKFTTGCAQFLPAGTSLTLTEQPLAGETYFYLIRPRTPNKGSWGQTSAGVARTGFCLPL